MGRRVDSFWPKKPQALTDTVEHMWEVSCSIPFDRFFLNTTYFTFDTVLPRVAAFHRNVVPELCQH